MTDATEALARAMCFSMGTCSCQKAGDITRCSVWRQYFDKAAQFSKALAAQGYAVVPLEPTEKMTMAGAGEAGTHTVQTYRSARTTYKAMIKAAQGKADG